jgi:hypothetical protein
MHLITFEQAGHGTILFTTLKKIRRAILCSTSTDRFYNILTSIQTLFQ